MTSYVFRENERINSAQLGLTLHNLDLFCTTWIYSAQLGFSQKAALKDLYGRMRPQGHGFPSIFEHGVPPYPESGPTAKER